MTGGLYRACKAMRDAGITDPNSSEGILFCAGDRMHESQCPYEYCVVVEHGKTARQLKKDGKVKLAKDLKKAGVALEDIALIIDRSLFQVRRYLSE